LLFLAAVLLFAGKATLAQDWVRTGTGLGVDKPRLAVADFAARNDATKNHSALFTQVVRDDLQFSGILELVSPSFYPQQMPSVPAELKNLAWTDQPVNASLVAFGNLNESSAEVEIQAWLYDVKSPSSQAVIGKV
jgi:Tol biopolymer transport system component